MRTKRTLVAIALAALVAVSVGAAPVAAAQDDSPPPPPAAYYGEVTLNGDPAPTGTTVTAVVDGEERGSISLSEAGAYGGPAVGDEKLQVDGTRDDEGATVTFLVDGIEADQTVEWTAGDHRQVDLTAEGDPDDGSPGGGGPPGDGGGAPPSDGDDDDDEDDSEAVNESDAGPPEDIPAANVSATETVEISDADPDSPGVTVTMNETSVSAITLVNESIVGNDTDGSAAGGNVTVSDVEAPPEEIGAPTGQTIATIQIDVPEFARNDPATIQLTIDPARVAELDADEDELVVNRYNESAGEWQQLKTRVVASDGDSLTLEAETPGFSFFSVTVPENRQNAGNDTPESTATATDDDGDATGTDTTGGGSDEVAGTGPGPLVVLVVVVVLAVIGGLVAVRRFTE